MTFSVPSSDAAEPRAGDDRRQGRADPGDELLVELHSLHRRRCGHQLLRAIDGPVKFQLLELRADGRGVDLERRPTARRGGLRGGANGEIDVAEDDRLAFRREIAA